LGDLGIDGRITLKRILDRAQVKERWQEPGDKKKKKLTSGLHKRRENS
jgi:hypothetical protein